MLVRCCSSAPWPGCSPGPGARRGADASGAPVLADEAVTAAELRAPGRGGAGRGAPRATPCVDGFRALAVRQVERGRLDDAPGATAHEVADALAAAYPEQRRRVDGSARPLRRGPLRPPAGDAGPGRRRAGARRRAGGAAMSPAAGGAAQRRTGAAPSPRRLVAAPRRAAVVLRAGRGADRRAARPRQPRPRRRPRRGPRARPTRASTSQRGPRRRRARRAAGPAAGTTVVVTSAERLGASTTPPAARRTARGAGLVRGRPGAGHPRGPGPLGRRAGAGRAGRRRAGATAPTRRTTGCGCEVDSAPRRHRRRLLPRRARCLVAEPRAGRASCSARGRLLTNEQVLRGRQRRRGPAAARPATTGWSGTSPTLADLVGRRRRQPGHAAPAWLVPGLWLLGAAVVALLLWRSGGSARSPPSRCRSWCAIETTRSRGRLYRAGRRPRPRRRRRCAAPRGRRLAERLRLPPAPTRPRWSRDVARHLGRPRRRGRRPARRRRPLRRHRPRPDHPGRRAGRARQRGTPP